MNRAMLLFAASAAAALWPVPASAGQPSDFNDTAFAAAQNANALVVLETYASWCLPCKLQEPLLADAKKRAEFRSLRVLRIGEETPAPVWRRFRLSGYGVIVVFRNGQEVARGSPTNAAAMHALLRSGA